MKWGERSQLRELFAAADPLRVRLAQDLLKIRGIDAHVFDEQSYYMERNVLVRLVVRADDYDQALAELKARKFLTP